MLGNKEAMLSEAIQIMMISFTDADLVAKSTMWLRYDRKDRAIVLWNVCFDVL